MVEMTSKLAEVVGLNAYKQKINDDNVRTQAQIINDNIRLNKQPADRGFDSASTNNQNFDLTIPKKAETDYDTQIRGLNTDVSKMQRASDERRRNEEYINQALNEKGIGLNVNILV
jgi:hypothetical protein